MVRTSTTKDCYRPPVGSSKADLQELHREKMRNKRARGERMFNAYRQDKQAIKKVAVHLEAARERTHNWRIWPYNKVAKPGRML